MTITRAALTIGCHRRLQIRTLNFDVTFCDEHLRRTSVVTLDADAKAEDTRLMAK